MVRNLSVPLIPIFKSVVPLPPPPPKGVNEGKEMGLTLLCSKRWGARKVGL